MEITRISIATNVMRTLDLPVTPQQMEAFKSGQLVQLAFPHLSADEREFILTGIVADERDNLFKEMKHGEKID